MTMTSTIKWKPFSEKHKKYIQAALKNKMNVAEGAIRSGKTIDHCIVAAAYLETCPDRIHLASGFSVANAKLNIGVCNGYGLENLFRGRCHWGKFRDNEALYIQTQTGEKVIIFVGGGKADSYKRILGNSYGLWIATEINEHYDCEDSRTSFIKVAFGRQAAAEYPLILWDLNPCNPNHTIYENYIDKYVSGFAGGYQYQHFTIDDNLSISEDRKKEIKSQYDINSTWYVRDILGQRCIADGLVYQCFNDSMIVNSGQGQHYYISVDYGTMNPFSMGLWVVDHGNKIATRLKEYYYNGRKQKRQMTDADYYKEIEALAKDKVIQSIVVDPSAASLIALIRQKGHYVVTPATNDVDQGIRTTRRFLKAGNIKICSCCVDCLREFRSYLFDPTSIEDRPIKENDHAMDEVRYFAYTILKRLGW